MAVAYLERTVGIETVLANRTITRSHCESELDRMDTVRINGVNLFKDEYIGILFSEAQDLLAGVMGKAKEMYEKQMIKTRFESPHYPDAQHTLLFFNNVSVCGVNLFLGQRQYDNGRNLYNGGYGSYARFKALKNNPVAPMLTFLPEHFEYPDQLSYQAHILHGRREIGRLATAIGIRFAMETEESRMLNAITDPEPRILPEETP